MALPATIKAGKDPGLEEGHRGVRGAATSPNDGAPAAHFGGTGRIFMATALPLKCWTFHKEPL